jgi:hypothetical protein
MGEDIKEINWVEEMIKREAVPLQLREGTVADFCKKYNIGDSTYYYQSSKPENQEKIVNSAINNAKKYAPEVLENLGERAKKNSKDAEMYLKFILQLADKTDITSKGESIQQVLVKFLNGKDETTKDNRDTRGV